MSRDPRWRADDGQVAGIEALAFGLLVFVVGSLIVASGWAVVDTKQTLAIAAREAVRSTVEDADPATAERRARASAEEVVEGLGRDVDRLTVQLSTDGRRCTPVTVRATYSLPAIAVPFVGRAGPPITVRAAHTELVDPHRSGLSGAAACAR